MYTDTVRSTTAPNKPSALDRYLAAMVLAGTQDQEYLRGLAPEHRDRAKNAVKDLELLRHLPEGRARDMALDRLARYVAREWEPKGRIETALNGRAEIEEKPRAVMKHEAIRYGVFIAHTQLYRVQLVQLGPGRNRAVVVDGVLALGTDDCAGVTSEWPLMNPTPSRSAVYAAVTGCHAVANGAKNLVWTAIVGPTRPGDLRVEHRLPWFRRKAIRLAEAWLLDEPERLARRTSDALQRATPLPEDLPACLDDATSPEDLQEARWLVSALRDRASPRERELLRFLWMHPDSPDREVAVELGVAPATIRVMKRNLRKKAAQLTT